jgi:hypothetical protein
MEAMDEFWGLRGRLLVLENVLAIVVRTLSDEQREIVTILLNELSSQADKLNGLESGATEEEARLHGIESAARAFREHVARLLPGMGTMPS